MTRWSTLLLDEADLATMAVLPAEAATGHLDAVTRGRPTSRALFRRWEQQQWVANDVSLERDTAHWHRIPAPVQRRLVKLITDFLVGEYTGLDLLGPILTGCPDEDALLYLGTQLADESRHTRFVHRVAVEVVGMPPDFEAILPAAWRAASPAQRRLSALETRLIRKLVTQRPDYEDWLRAVTVFHVVTEGVLATHGQRAVVTSLKPGGLLPGIRSGFVAMTRDESRHVAFGLQAIRTAIRDGHEEAVTDVLSTAVPLAMATDIYEVMDDTGRARAADVARSLGREAVSRMRQIGLPANAADKVMGIATAAVARQLRDAGGAA